MIIPIKRRLGLTKRSKCWFYQNNKAKNRWDCDIQRRQSDHDIGTCVQQTTEKNPVNKLMQTVGANAIILSTPNANQIDRIVLDAITQQAKVTYPVTKPIVKNMFT